MSKTNKITTSFEVYFGAEYNETSELSSIRFAELLNCLSNALVEVKLPTQLFQVYDGAYPREVKTPLNDRFIPIFTNEKASFTFKEDNTNLVQNTLNVLCSNQCQRRIALICKTCDNTVLEAWCISDFTITSSVNSDLIKYNANILQKTLNIDSDNIQMYLKYSSNGMVNSKVTPNELARLVFKG
jgi:hypothetical protein